MYVSPFFLTSIQDGSFTDADIMKIVDVIRANKPIEELQLSSKVMKMEEIISIGEALEFNSKLTILDLSGEFF